MFKGETSSYLTTQPVPISCSSGTFHQRGRLTLLLCFRKAGYGRAQEDHPKPTSYDPRHPNDQTLNPEHVGALLDKLKSTCPTSGIRQFWNLLGESTLTFTENEEEAMNVRARNGVDVSFY